MTWMRFLHRKPSDAELQNEIEAFLSEETADNVARGMSPDEARRQARIKLGNPQKVRESLRDKDGDRGALIQELSEDDWRAIPIDPFTAGFRDVDYVRSREDALRFAHLYQTFYRIRRKRDLSWYRGALHQIIESEIEITTPEPIRVLCGIEDPGSGWRVFRYDRRNGWVRVHNGASEAAARWEYERIKDPVPTAAILIDPAHQIINHIGGSKELW